MFFGDQGGRDELLAAIRSASGMARSMLDEMLGFVDEYPDEGGPLWMLERGDGTASFHARRQVLGLAPSEPARPFGGSRARGDAATLATRGLSELLGSNCSRAEFLCAARPSSRTTLRNLSDLLVRSAPPLRRWR